MKKSNLLGLDIGHPSGCRSGFSEGIVSVPVAADATADATPVVTSRSGSIAVGPKAVIRVHVISAYGSVTITVGVATAAAAAASAARPEAIAVVARASWSVPAKRNFLSLNCGRVG